MSCRLPAIDLPIHRLALHLLQPCRLLQLLQLQLSHLRYPKQKSCVMLPCDICCKPYSHLTVFLYLYRQVAVVVTEPDSEQVEEISTPPTEPQVEPIEIDTTEPWSETHPVVSCHVMSQCKHGWQLGKNYSVVVIRTQFSPIWLVKVKVATKQLS